MRALADVFRSEGKIMIENEPGSRVSRTERVSVVDINEPHLLVFTADEAYAHRLRTMLSSQPFGATFVKQLEGLDVALRRVHRFDVVLVDVASLSNDWPHLFTQVESRFQTASCMAVIEADQSALLDDLFSYGITDYLDKSASARMFQTRVGNVLRLRQLELENTVLRQDGRERSHEMVELQRVMATMERNAERAAKEIEYRIFTQIRALVMPLFEELAGQSYGQVSEESLNALRKYVNDLASGLASHLQGSTSLSAQELRVALMVKNGMTSEEIAAHLHVSPETIKTHRRNIRRKFGLTSSNQKLSVYLQSLRPLDTLQTEGREGETAPEA